MAAKKKTIAQKAKAAKPSRKKTEDVDDKKLKKKTLMFSRRH